MLHDIVQSYESWEPMVLWDGRAEHRFELLPQYKESRRKRREEDPQAMADHNAYEAQVPFIRKIVEYLGITQVLCTKLEADDLAGYYTPRIITQGGKVLLVTGDSDWWQLVREGVVWLDPRSGSKRVTMQNFLEMTGYHEPIDYLNGKCLMGDGTDDVPPVGGIGEKGAPLFVAEFRSVREFLRRVDAGEFKPKKKAHINLASKEGREKFERNWKLISLIDGPSPTAENTRIWRAQVDRERLKMIFERLSFISILRDFEAFIKPFEALQAARTT